jgi:hypothetical protein
MVFGKHENLSVPETGDAEEALTDRVSENKDSVTIVNRREFNELLRRLNS